MNLQDLPTVCSSGGILPLFEFLYTDSNRLYDLYTHFTALDTTYRLEGINDRLSNNIRSLALESIPDTLFKRLEAILSKSFLEYLLCECVVDSRQVFVILFQIGWPFSFWEHLSTNI